MKLLRKDKITLLTKTEIIESYNKEAKIYDRRRFESKVGQYYYEVEKLRILEWLKGPKILELGCGTGRYTIPFAKLGFDYTGVDIAPAMLGVAREKARRAGVEPRLIIMDAHELAFEDETFDSVFCDRTFKFFQHPMRVLREVYRVLKPGGRIIIDTETEKLSQRLPSIYIYPIYALIHIVIAGWFECYRPDEEVIMYSKEKLEQMFRRVGFRILESTRMISFPTFLVAILPQRILKDLVNEKSIIGRIRGPKALVVGEKNGS